MRSGWTCAATALALFAAAQTRAQDQDQDQAATTSTAPSEIVSTAPAGPDAPKTTSDQISAWINGARPLGVADEDDSVIAAGPRRDLHGEVGAFVGNHGYGGYAAANMPVGKQVTVGVAISDAHFNGRYFGGDAGSLGADWAFGQAANRPVVCSVDSEFDPRFDDPEAIRHVRGAALYGDRRACLGTLRSAR
jgi:hypothetical protein